MTEHFWVLVLLCPPLPPPVRFRNDHRAEPTPNYELHQPPLRHLQVPAPARQLCVCGVGGGIELDVYVILVMQ